MNGLAATAAYYSCDAAALGWSSWYLAIKFHAMTMLYPNKSKTHKAGVRKTTLHTIMPDAESFTVLKNLHVFFGGNTFRWYAMPKGVQGVCLDIPG